MDNSVHNLRITAKKPMPATTCGGKHPRKQKIKNVWKHTDTLSNLLYKRFFRLQKRRSAPALALCITRQRNGCLPGATHGISSQACFLCGIGGKRAVLPQHSAQLRMRTFKKPLPRGQNVRGLPLVQHKHRPSLTRRRVKVCPHAMASCRGMQGLGIRNARQTSGGYCQTPD